MAFFSEPEVLPNNEGKRNHCYNGLSFQNNEANRLATLKELQILDTEPEKEFDDLVSLAATLCDSPISSLAFVDDKRSWLKAKIGVGLKEIPREQSFCASNIGKSKEIVIVEDTLENETFSENPHVVNEPFIRFFAGVPIIINDLVVGELCVMDIKPKKLSPSMENGLKVIGRQVVKLLELRMQFIEAEKKKKEYRSSAEFLETIFENAVDAVIIVNEEGTIQQWNPKAEHIFGWAPQEVLGKPFLAQLIPTKNHELVRNEMEKAYTNSLGKKNHNVLEIPAKAKGYKNVDIALGISPASIQGKNFYIFFISDITHRKMVAKELGMQKKFYENILNNIPTDLAVFDDNHRYIFVNPSGIKNEELRKFIIGKDDFEYAAFRGWDIFIPQNRRKRFEELKESKKEIVWEDTVYVNGKYITQLRRLFPVYDEAENLSMVIGYGIDITERKKLEEKQSALVKQLSEQNAQLIDFCNIVSHNLRAPLVNMAMLTKMIEEEENTSEQKLMIAMLNPVIQNLHATFNDLVETIQIKQDLEISCEKNLLTECISKVLECFELDIRKTGAIITVSLEDAPIIHFPPKYLNSILHNFISNALKYKSPERNPSINISTQPTGESIILKVSDNGLGIDLEKHKDNLFKIGKVFHHHPESKGFGLYMTKTQVEAKGGKIWVESTPGKGTTFYIEFFNQNI
jgi:PAS domain S-box-containing protein